MSSTKTQTSYSEPPKYEKYIGMAKKWMDEAGLEHGWMPRLIAKTIAHELEGDKGFILCGCTGWGKTLRLKVLSDNLYIPMEDARELAKAFMQNDSAQYMRDRLNCQQYAIYGDAHHVKHDLIIDDLGKEYARGMVYGTVRDIMGEVIDLRYMEFQRHGWRTFFASNLNKKALEESYDERIWSRLNEMCLFIEVQGQDRRMAR